MTVFRALALAATVLALIASPAFAADFTVPPTPDHYVTDEAGALGATARDALETELRTFESATGHQVIVYIGKSTGPVPLETWTGETAQKWGIGHKGKEDGAVLFLFMTDRKVRIEVGYGLEGSLPDASASRIITDDIVPRMKSGDVDGAVTAGVSAMLTTIDPQFTLSATPAPESSGDDSNGWVVWIFLLFFLFIAIWVVMQIVASITYGVLLVREGKQAAINDVRRSWIRFFLGTSVGGVVSSSSGFSGGGGFSAGGGSFGGGGASGGW